MLHDLNFSADKDGGAGYFDQEAQLNPGAHLVAYFQIQDAQN